MHVEIDNGNAADAVTLPGVVGADGDVVEQAEAHRPVGLRMMAGRTNRAEYIPRLAAYHRIHAGDHGSRRAQGGIA
jgi:hypothetical protein